MEDENELTEKKQRRKKSFFSIVFSRKVLIITLLLLQLLGLWVLFFFLAQFVVYVYGIFLVFQLILITSIINSDSDSAFQISWLALITAVPVVGILFYLFVKSQLGTRKLREKLKVTTVETMALLEPARKESEQLTGRGYDDGLIHYVEESGGFPACRNSEVVYFPSGEAHFPELLKALEAAEKFIFIQYFIVEPGEMWDETLRILAKKAMEGVEVRFMYDGTCTLNSLPIRYPRTLENMGIHCRVFSPIRPVFTTVQNNRNHRKIVVIDGKTAFTGGVNMADEYINRKVRFGYWKDVAVMVRGTAVDSFTAMFLQLWNLYGFQDGRDKDFIGLSRGVPEAGGLVLPYGDSPVFDERIGEFVYLNMLNRAEKYVHIFTPYLIPDQGVVTALKFAARRGVDVRLILPHIPDKKYVYLLAWAYYEDLIPAGVKIYEFEPGFVHAKCFVSDDMKAVVGTVNLDFRSLYLHFECGVYMEDVPAVRMVEKDFQETLQKCRRITEADVAAYPKKKKVLADLMRIMAPQL